MAATLYKARGMARKQPVCAICVDRTQGRTQRLVLTHGVSVWLCAEHASPEFQRRRSGRDFVRTLMGVWQANGCLTASRGKALSAHIAAQQGARGRRRPGSYAWPELRRQVEAAYAAGATVAGQAERIAARYRDCPARTPSLRTLQRWRAQRRWLITPPRPTQRQPPRPATPAQPAAGSPTPPPRPATPSPPSGRDPPATPPTRPAA